MLGIRRRERDHGRLPEPVQLHGADYDVAATTFMHVVDAIHALPREDQHSAWGEVIEVLGALPSSRLHRRRR